VYIQASRRQLIVNNLAGKVRIRDSSTVFEQNVFQTFKVEATLQNNRTPDDQNQLLGVRIDTDVALRMTRTLWEVLSQHDPILRDKLAHALQSEIDGLALQEELDEGGKPGNDGATLQILKLYQAVKAA
jgi:hypothetical protein